MKHGKFNLVIGLQAGSESKGKISAYLAEKYEPDLIVGNFSPNAGHTYHNNDKSLVCYNIPVAMVKSKAPLVLGAGSAINIKTLKEDCEKVGLTRERVYVDWNAVIIQDRHMEEEATCVSHIASTAQGVGTAYRDRLMRVQEPIIARQFQSELASVAQLTTASWLINAHLEKGSVVLGEMTQGFDLDLLHGIEYPFCTSRPVNPAQMLSDCGVHPSFIGSVYGVFRPYPIRVGNADGFSGPYAGAQELTWDEVRARSGAPYDITEMTTTTKRVRRVFEFSQARFTEALRVCRPSFLALNFANYVDWGAWKVKRMAGLPPKVITFLEYIAENFGTPVKLIGTGPDHADIVDLL